LRLVIRISQKDTKVKTSGIFGKKGRASTSLAAYNSAPSGPGASLLRDDGIDYGARNNALDATPGGSSCTVKSLRGVTEQGVHVCDSTFIGAEMDSERFDGARAVPGTGNRNFTARGGHADILGGKAENPSLTLSFQTSATLTLEANHGCTSRF